MELCYMNKTNISWLRDNREIYLTNIEIKHSADQQPQRLVNDSVPPFDGLLRDGLDICFDFLDIGIQRVLTLVHASDALCELIQRVLTLFNIIEAVRIGLASRLDLGQLDRYFLFVHVSPSLVLATMISVMCYPRVCCV